MSDDIPAEVIEAFDLADATLTPIATGWINRTLRVERGDERFVLQRLHPVFDGSVNRDIDAITRHLEAAGLRTPRVVPARTGALWIDVERPWRMLTFVEGQTHDVLDSPARARSAGAMAGRFHRALADLTHEFAFTRPGAHDTPAHLAKLRPHPTCRYGHDDGLGRAELVGRDSLFLGHAKVVFHSRVAGKGHRRGIVQQQGRLRVENGVLACGAVHPREGYFLLSGEHAVVLLFRVSGTMFRPLPNDGVIP